MRETILVTYASCTGSTAGVAKAVAETLLAKGATVAVQSMADVTDLTPYAAVVVGLRHPGQAVAAGGASVCPTEPARSGGKADGHVHRLHDPGHAQRREIPARGRPVDSDSPRAGAPVE